MRDESIKTLNSLEIKKRNRSRVFRRMLQSPGRVSMQEIADALSLSKPTVLQLLRELLEQGLVVEDGEFASIGGRKAKAFLPQKDARYALGIDLTQNHVSMVMTDLSCEVLSHVLFRHPFSIEEDYRGMLTQEVEAFLAKVGCPRDQILGIGLAFPAIIDMKENRVTISNALGVKGVVPGDLLSLTEYPVQLINDANAAAAAEYIGTNATRDLCYLNLSNTVGGALIFPGIPSNSWEATENPYDHMFFGPRWHSAEVGHLVIHPGGKRCYCGKPGCADAYLSATRLSDPYGGVLDAFFKDLSAGVSSANKLWDAYLDDLAILVDNVWMLCDCEVVIGGYVGNYMTPWIDGLKERLAQKDIFGEKGSFIRPCTFHREAAALGAASWMVESFLSSL